jgi:ABC-type nickel/cobalt efflux system permease component RcnA
MKRLSAIATIAVTLVILPASAALAHPLGNFTINTYSGIRMQSESVIVRYVVDMAEIPTFQERSRIAAPNYARGSCATISSALELIVDDSPARLNVAGSSARLLPGAAGLQTLRLECNLQTDVAMTPHAIRYHDNNFLNRVGWHEVTAVGDGSTLAGSSVPSKSITAELTRYPDDLLQSPVDVRGAAFRTRPGGARVTASSSQTTPSLLPRGVDGATRAFSSFLTDHGSTPAFAILALIVAVGLGAVHALAPGHGKTVVAAVIVGERGSWRQGALLGLVVTATHTAGVLALGLLLSVSSSAAPDRVYPFLGLASGAMLATIGAGLLRRNLPSRRSARRRVPHAHPHPHRSGQPAMSSRTLAAMGLAGGLVPSPSAVVVLLGAVALQRAWLGVGLVVAYGAGMALTLCSAGFLLSRVRTLIDRRSSRGTFDRLARLLPLSTAAVITVIGLTVAARGITQI